MDCIARDRPSPRRLFSTLATLGLVIGMLVMTDSAADAAPLAGRIVYSDIFGGSGLYSIAPDGTGRTHLVDDSVYRPQWHPDGSGVSFIVEVGPRGRSTRLDTVDADGSDRQVLLGRAQLPAGWKAISTYDWSPDGTQLVLCLVDDKFERPRLYVSTPDGSLMNLLLTNACSPDWSSQGRILALRGRKLLELDPDGGNLVTIQMETQTADPAWSPDGSKIAFMCGPYVHVDICVINADGSDLVNLTQSERIDWSPSWSPNGTRIVWAPSTNTKYQFGDLWRMRADGSGKTRLTRTPQIDEYEPDWSAVA